MTIPGYLKIPIAVSFLLLLGYTIPHVMHLDWYFLGIMPRNLYGATGILTSALIHKDLAHMLFNLFPLFAGLTALYFFYSQLANRTLFLLWIMEGFLTWCIGRTAWHIGASGLVYGLLSFLLMSAFMRRNRALSVVAALVVFFYGGLFWGLFPIQADVSFESHVSGFVSGIVLAVVFRNKGPQNDKAGLESDDERDDPYMEFED